MYFFSSCLCWVNCVECFLSAYCSCKRLRGKKNIQKGYANINSTVKTAHCHRRKMRLVVLNSSEEARNQPHAQSTTSQCRLNRQLSPQAWTRWLLCSHSSRKMLRKCPHVSISAATPLGSNILQYVTFKDAHWF